MLKGDLALISPDVVILTRVDLQKIKDDAYQRGVQRGIFEATNKDYRNEPIAANCINWRNGRCDMCGVQWQGCEVSADFRCQHFRQHPDRS